MRRRVLNLLTAFSLLLFVGATVLAVRSHRALDMVDLRWKPGPARPVSSGRIVHCTSFPGVLWLTVDRVTDADAGFWREVSRVGGRWSYVAGGDGSAAAVAGGHYRGRQPSRGWWRFRWDRSEMAPCDIEGGRAARVVTRIVVVPHWAVVLLTVVLPLARLPSAAAALRRRVTPARGHCAGCGYDLRATPGRCPECGAETAATAC